MLKWKVVTFSFVRSWNRCGSSTCSDHIWVPLLLQELQVLCQWELRSFFVCLGHLSGCSFLSRVRTEAEACASPGCPSQGKAIPNLHKLCCPPFKNGWLYHLCGMLSSGTRVLWQSCFRTER